MHWEANGPAVVVAAAVIAATVLGVGMCFAASTRVGMLALVAVATVVVDMFTSK